MQTFTAPITGNYKLEVWGAASGKYFNSNKIISNNHYGRGGYSDGYYSMNVNQTIYISIGGEGENGKLARSTGGWNGGGDGEWDHHDDEGCAGGGGCTSIQNSLISDGQLKHYEFVKNTDVLIVAGGGGGGRKVTNNGFAGGETGSFTNASRGESGYLESFEPQQATQTSGYAFGLGQSAPTDFTNIKNSEVSGGGGGWYGGYTFIPTVEEVFVHNAGGGSGHIGGMLTNGSTIAGNQTFPSPGGGTEKGHRGNGYCIISWILPSL